MILVHYPSKNPAPVQEVKKYPSPFVNTGPHLLPREVLRATKLKITNAEYLRRDGIIRKHAADCPWNVGDVVTPKSNEGFEKYGECVITAIVNSYLNYDDDSWPKTDNPMILHFRTKDGKEAFATTNYFKDKVTC